MLIHQETLPHTRCPPKIICPRQLRLGGTPAAAPVTSLAPSPVTTPVAISTVASDAAALTSASQTTKSKDIPAAQAGTSSELPYYDVIIMIIGQGTENDRKRMDAAEATWLKSENPGVTYTYFFAICQDDPGLKCSGKSDCFRDRPHVVVLPCIHGYKFLATKSVEGYKYIASTYEFRWVLKIDVDSLIDMRCVAKSLHSVSKKCPSFGMGLWRVVGDSKVFGPEHGKYDNTAFKQDTGSDAYPPYMTGWVLLWSADVARFLGMAGAESSEMPKWRTTWTIDDAAIGTFVLGLDMCRLPLTCPVWTSQEGSAMQSVWEVLSDPSKKTKVGAGGAIEGFMGPFKDDVPDLGDLYNLQADDLGHCASICRSNSACASFEFSPTAGEKWDDPIKNCQIASRTNRAGTQWRDYTLYIRTNKK